VANGLKIGDGREFQHKRSIEELHLNIAKNCHTKHRSRHYSKRLLGRCPSCIENMTLLIFSTLVVYHQN